MQAYRTPSSIRIRCPRNRVTFIYVAQPGEVAVQRDIKQRFFHGQVAPSLNADKLPDACWVAIGLECDENQRMNTDDRDNLGTIAPVAAQAWSALADGRCSSRRFIDTSVPDEWIVQMLQEARRAPSGANLQPGEFIRIEGSARQRLSERLVEAYLGGAPQNEDYSYFPDPIP
jgi:hypothetical protein